MNTYNPWIITTGLWALNVFILGVRLDDTLMMVLSALGVFCAIMGWVKT